MSRIGIIGGSGLDDPDFFTNSRDEEIITPYGTPSSLLKHGQIEGRDVVLLARHGRLHTIPPSQVNNRANIHALKQVGCTVILATTAVGSLREEIGRGHLVLLDQFIDFTRHRSHTFFESFKDGVMKHTPMADPFNDELRGLLAQVCMELKLDWHEQGTVVTIEGPRFSTRAESHMFRSWGADVINMTTAPECILANEVQVPYAAVAMSTDYDCWKQDEDPVSWEAVLKIFHENADKVTDLLRDTIPRIPQED
ncbi:MAG: S-methyl-5'-thioadenosine phosphorylase [Rhodospirillaceae bacterium]|nr:S-methyl-5'-thioadenosine phosphorylase [Rhodospirillaceae bacterium]